MKCITNARRSNDDSSFETVSEDVTLPLRPRAANSCLSLSTCKEREEREGNDCLGIRGVNEQWQCIVYSVQVA